jgi:hypothetical protein
MNIDRIARAMVDVEPSVDLEARIRRRLDEARPARTAAWWTWRVAAPMAAIASVALGFIIVQGPASSVQRPASTQATAASPLTEVPSSPIPEVLSSSGPQVPRSLGRQVQRSQAARVASSQLSSEEMAWMERRIPALDPVNALEMDRLRVDSIQPEPLAITPLTMTPVATEGGGIERRNDR